MSGSLFSSLEAACKANVADMRWLVSFTSLSMARPAGIDRAKQNEICLRGWHVAFLALLLKAKVEAYKQTIRHLDSHTAQFRA